MKQLLSIVAHLCLAAAAYSQVIHAPSYPLIGTGAGDFFGFSVSGAGDVNSDGFDDVIVGAWESNGNGEDSGTIRVFSGKTGGVIYTFHGDAAFDHLGICVSRAGDVNGDGFDDFIAGADLNDVNGSSAGSARVFSGANGAILYTFFGESAGDQFGLSVADAGDVNQDGFDDVVVGSPFEDNNGSNSGSARVYSGVSGEVLHLFNGDGVEDRFGRAVSGAGDVNNDGFDDVIVGARFDDNNGRPNSGMVRVFSGVTGGVLYELNGDQAGDEFGWEVSGAGDVNDDGFDDFIVGAQFGENTEPNTGSARVFSGQTGGILYSFYGDNTDDRFGRSVAGAGDVNKDGHDDVIVGAYLDDDDGMNSGSARVFSGANGATLYTFRGDLAGDQFGQSVSGAGDVNNDGFADFIVGSDLADIDGQSSGTARIFLSTAIGETCPGDADGNNVVNFADITEVLTRFNLSCP